MAGDPLNLSCLAEGNPRPVIRWSSRQEAGPSEGREAGLSKGREAGLSEGREAGVSVAREAGLSEVREAGLFEGQEAGPPEGQEAGPAEGRSHTGQLVFPAVSLADAGIYVCEATNLKGQQSADVELQVHGERRRGLVGLLSPPWTSTVTCCTCLCFQLRPPTPPCP